MALSVVCFAFLSVFLFDFWPTSLATFVPFLAVLPFWKMGKFLSLSLCSAYLLLWIGLGTNIPMSLPSLESPADIVLPEGTKLTIPFGLSVVWGPKEEVGTIFLWYRQWLTFHLDQNHIVGVVNPELSGTLGK
jgi:hypothetical protein